MPVCVTREQIRALRVVADDWAHKSASCADPSEVHTYREDGKDLHAVADALARSEYASAQRLVEEMETLVQDLIPSSLYGAVGLRALR